jgi:hypothetical protein
MTAVGLAAAAFLLAVLPALLFRANLRAYRPRLTSRPCPRGRLFQRCPS